MAPEKHLVVCQLEEVPSSQEVVTVEYYNISSKKTDKIVRNSAARQVNWNQRTATGTMKMKHKIK